MSATNVKRAPGEAPYKAPRAPLAKVPGAPAAVARSVTLPKSIRPPPPGSGKIITSACWLAQRGREGVPVKLRVTVDPRAAEDGTPLKGGIFKAAQVSDDACLEPLEGQVAGGAWTGTWTYDASEDKGAKGKPQGDLAFVFKAEVKGAKAVSQRLPMHGFCELTTLSEEEKPRSVRYVVRLPDGSERKGETDDKGAAVIEPVPPGEIELQFLLHDGVKPPEPDDLKDATPDGKTVVESKNSAKAFRLKTGKAYRFAFETCTFGIELEIDPEAEIAADDIYTLFSSDEEKTYSQKRTVRDDKVPGDGVLTLEYADLNPDLSYTLLADPGAQGESYRLFEDVAYDELDGGGAAS